MGYGKLGLKLLGLHAMLSLVGIFLYLLLFGVFPDSELYQWFIGLLFVGMFWIVVHGYASSYGQKHLKQGVFTKAKGFVSGLIASIPGLILYAAASAYKMSGLDSEYLSLIQVIMRLWLIPYIKFFVAFEKHMPYIAIIFILLFPIVTGFSYLDGQRLRERDLKAIQKKEAMRRQLSKRDS
jgi:hypothetical protein